MKHGFSSQGPLHIRFASGFFLRMIFVTGVLLAGCTSVEQRQANVMDRLDDLADTASGTLAGTKEKVQGAMEAGRVVIETGKATVEGAKQVVEDVNDRVKSVQEGIEKIQEGKKLIEAGVTVGSGSER
ncbi:MAG: hypothetical protein PHE68_04245 [Candidatus Peribacteraceae bacterium]|nr:hypothetical protein [Candidatus Peribacteraceae bacterium]MDD5074671.1 hypothetical protein [Candidatus Peribacteraceae bacterium]